MVNFIRPRVRNLQIETHFGGFSVYCGCINKIYTDVEEMIKDVTEYLRDPDHVEEQWRQTKRKQPSITEPGADTGGGMKPVRITDTERSE